jgi:hypothetical protein
MTEVNVIPTEVFNIAKLSEIELPATFEEAVKALHTMGASVDNAAGVLEDEFPEIDKERLINREILLLTWSVSKPGEGEYGDGQYIVVRGITRDGKRFRFADGSTGIMAQLVGLTKKRIQDKSHAVPNAGLLCPTGLTKSEYTYTNEKGEKTPAKTYYVSNAE